MNKYTQPIQTKLNIQFATHQTKWHTSWLYYTVIVYEARLFVSVALYKYEAFIENIQCCDIFQCLVELYSLHWYTFLVNPLPIAPNK